MDSPGGELPPKLGGSFAGDDGIPCSPGVPRRLAMFELPTPIYLAAVLALGVAAQWLAWRVKLPAIVLLLFFGFGWGYLVGPPENYLGIGPQGRSILFPMVSLAVGVILFEGGLNLRFQEIRDHGGVVIRLVSIGLAITAVLAAIAAITWWTSVGPWLC